jgi:hypothetical protein
VIDHAPASSATGVASSAHVMIAFDQDMDLATLGGVYFTVSSGTQNVPDVFVLTDRTIDFMPDSALDLGRTYTATLSVHACNVAIMPISQVFSWTFETAAGVDMEQDTTLPAGHLLVSAYPNPFNARTILSIEMDRSSKVVVEAYSVDGRRLGRVDAGVMPSGTHAIPVDVGKGSTGLILLKVRVGDALVIRPVLMVK